MLIDTLNRSQVLPAGKNTTKQKTKNLRHKNRSKVKKWKKRGKEQKRIIDFP